MASREFNMHVKQGDQYSREGKYDSAIAEYQKALRIDPNNVEVRKNLTKMFLEKGAYNSAISEYIAWAEVCRARGAYDEAIEVYKKALSIDSTVGKQRGIIARSGSGSLSAVRDAIKEYSGDLHCRLGIAYMEKGDTEEAIKELQRSLEITPGNALAHSCLGSLYSQRGMDKEAIGEYQEVLRLSPKDAGAYEKLGEIDLKGGKISSAINWFVKAGNTYEEEGHLDEGVNVYEKILELDGENVNILSKLGEIYIKRNEPTKAANIYKILADIYTREGLLDKVIILYERLVEWEPSNTEIRNKIINIYQRILQLDPNNLAARQKLIENLIGKGAIDDAIPEFLAFAKVQLERGMINEGVNALETVIEYDPLNVEARQRLAQVYEEQGMSEKSFEITRPIMPEEPRKQEEEPEEEIIVIEKEEPIAEETTTGLLEKSKEEIKQEILQKKESATTDIIPMTVFDKRGLRDIIIELERLVELNPNEPVQLIKLGDAYLTNKNYDMALDIYNKLKKINTEPNTANERLSKVYLALNDIEEALKIFSELAENYQQKQDYNASLKNYHRIIDFKPENTEILEKVNTINVLKGSVEEAISGYLLLSSAYLQKGNMEKSIDSCQKALELNPGNLALRQKLSKLYLSHGMINKATNEMLNLAEYYFQRHFINKSIDIYNSLLKLNPENTEARLKLAELFITLHNFEQGIKEFRNLVEIYLKRGMKDNAIKISQRIIELDNKNFPLLYELTDVFVSYHAVEEAIKICQIIASLSSKQYNIEEAIRAYRKIALIYQKEENVLEAGNTFHTIATLNMERNNLEEAIKAYYQAINNYEKIKNFSKIQDLRRILANTFLEQNRVEEAVNEYKNMASLFQKEGKIEETVYFHQTAVELYLQRLKNVEEAINEYLKLIDLYQQLNKGEKVIETYFKIARLYVNEGETEKAVKKAYRPIVKIYLGQDKYSEAIDIYNTIATVYQEAEEYQEAIKTYHQIAELYVSMKKNEELAETYITIGNLYVKMKEYDLAIESYQKILSYFPTHIAAHTHMIEVYQQKGNLNLAVDLSIKLMNIYNESGMLGKAEEFFDYAVSLSPNEDMIYYQMGELYYQNDQIKKAVEKYTQTLRINPQNTDASIRYAYCQAKLGKLQEALEEAKKLIDKGIIPEVIKAYKDTVTKTDKISTAHFEVGIAYKNLGFMEEAIEEFESAAQDPEIFFAAYNMIGICFKEQGLYPLAIKLIKKALTVECDDEYDHVELWYNLGQVYEELGNRKEARAAYMEAYGINIKYKDVAEKIKLLK